MASIYDEINKIKAEGNEYEQVSANEIDPQSNEYFRNFEQSIYNRGQSQAPTRRFASEKFEGYGNSKYDKGLSIIHEGDEYGSLEDRRARAQGALPQLMNNAINMGTIAGTTFIDSFLGTAAGIVNAIANPDPKGLEGQEEGTLSNADRVINNFVNNPVSIFLNSINKGVKEAMPTYTTDKFRENRENGQWYKNILSTEFIGETLIENFGFMAGMAASGKVSAGMMSKMLKTHQQLDLVRKAVAAQKEAGAWTGTLDEGLVAALKGHMPLKGLDSSLKNAVTGIRNRDAATSIVSTALATAGEAKIEAVNASEAYEQENLEAFNSPEAQTELINKTLYAAYAKNPEWFLDSPIYYQNPVEVVKPEYRDAIEALYEENKASAMEEIYTGRARVASYDFAVNFPALLASNAIQFANTFKGSYSTQRSFRKAFADGLRGRAEVQMAGANRVTGELGEMTAKKLSVGNRIARVMKNPLAEGWEEMSQASGERAATLYANTFADLDRDNETSMSFMDRMNALWQGSLETWGDIANYEEFFAGFVTGGLGFPNISMAKNAKGERKFIDGGIWGDLKKAKSEQQDLEAAVTALNERVKSPAFQAYMRNAVSREVLDDIKIDALDNGDRTTYENADHIQFIKDMQMFDALGKTQEFMDTIDATIERYDTYEDSAELAEKANEIRELGLSVNEGIDIFGNKLDSQILKETVDHNKGLKDKITDYLEISANLQDLLGDKFESDDEMAEMILLFSQITDMEARYERDFSELSKVLNGVKDDTFLKTKFDINLQGEDLSLNFGEIVQRATPSELVGFISGMHTNQFSEDYNYIQALFKSDSDIHSEIKRLENSLSSMYDNIWGKGGPTNTQPARKESRKQKKARKKAEASKPEPTKAEIEAVQKAKDNLNTLNNLLDNSIDKNLIIDLLNGLITIEYNRAHLANTYNGYIGAPQSLMKKLEDGLKETIAKETATKNKETTEKLKAASTMAELRDTITQIEKDGGRIPASILQNLGNIDNEKTTGYSPIVAEYNALHNLNRNIEKSLNELPDTPNKDFIVGGVRELWDYVRRSSDTIHDTLNYSATVDKDGGEITSALDTKAKQEVIDAFHNILGDLKNKNTAYSSLIGKSKPNPSNSKVSGTPINTNKDSGGRNASSPGRVDVKDHGGVSSSATISFGKKSKSEGQTESQGLSEDAKNKNRKSGADNSKADTPKSGMSYIKPSMYELDLSYYESTGKYRDNGMFKTVWEWLKEQGVWDYINKGNVQKGDKVSLVASSEYVETMREAIPGDAYWENNHPLLWVKEDPNGKLVINDTNYQVVGTYDTKNDASHAELQKKIADNPEGFLDTILGTTTVTHMNDGFIAVDKENPGDVKDRLASPITQSPREVQFGVSMGQGQLDFNKVDVGEVKPLDTDLDDAGRMYVLIPGANNRSLPMAMGVKTLEEIYNEEGSQIHGFQGDFFGQLKKSLQSVILSVYKEDGKYSRNLKEENAALAIAVGNLSSILYIGQKQGIPIYFNKRRKSTNSPEYEYFLKIGKSTEYSFDFLENRSIEDMIEGATQALIDVLAKPELGVRFSIDKNKLNTVWEELGGLQNPTYNEALISSGILYSDIVEYRVRGGHFEMNPIEYDSDTNRYSEQDATRKPAKAPIPTTTKEAPIGKNDDTYDVNGESWALTSGGSFVNTANPDMRVMPGTAKHLYISVMDSINRMSPESREAIAIPSTEFQGDLDNASLFIKTGRDSLYLYKLPNGNSVLIGNSVSRDVKLVKHAQAYLANKNAETSKTSTVEVSETAQEVGFKPSANRQAAMGAVKAKRGRTRGLAGGSSRAKASNNVTDAKGYKPLGTTENISKAEMDKKIREEKKDQKENCDPANLPPF